jgi:hypothetical protein
MCWRRCDESPRERAARDSCTPLAARGGNRSDSVHTCRVTSLDRSEWSISAGRLRYDHRSFDSRFFALRRQSIAAGWRPLLGAWDGFATDLVRHIAFEELSVFPGFTRHKPGDGVLIRRLLDEHAELRELVDSLTASIENDVVEPLALDGFHAAMSSHEEIENTRLYPWLELQDRGQDPGGRVRR